ncbi:MAG: DoxX family protein [Planctomycetota bacterium]
MDAQRTASDFGLFVLRVAMGGYFLAAGVFKAIGEIQNGLGSFYQGNFKALQPAWLPDVLAAPYGYALPWLEIVLGVMLVVGFFGRISAVLIGVMIASFTVALALKLGWTAQPPDAPGPISGNYLQLAAYVALVALGPGRWSVDGARGNVD